MAAAGLLIQGETMVATEHPNRFVKRGSEWQCKCGRTKVTEPAHLIAHVPKCCGNDMKYLGGRFRWAADKPLFGKD